MTTQKAINRLGPQKAGPSGDQRRTLCKLCRSSLLVGEPAVWLTNPMGLSHRACAARAGLAPAAAPADRSPVRPIAVRR